MPDEEAEFTLTAELDEPTYVPPAARCDKITFACSRDSARQSWNMSGPPAPPPSLAALAYARASAAQGFLSLEYVSELISNDVTRRMMTFAATLLFFLLLCWGLRTYRFRHRRRYRVPHETWE